MNTQGDSSFAPGTILDDKYEIVRIVGRGGMGEVYEATHTLIGRRVAIKTLHAAYASNPMVVQRFHQEAQLAGSIGHDNICEVTDVGTVEDGSPYLVMPLLKGEAFSRILKKRTKLPLVRLSDIICQTLSALEAAHSANIVHRDLKPDNIFITRIGDRSDFVKLLDFGISKVLAQDSVSDLTRTGTVLGTPFYMAPEQAKGSKTLDQRVDIYAIGVILYESLTGSKPFEGDTYNEVMFKIITQNIEAPSERDPSIPENMNRIVLKAMARDPEERYASAEEMRMDLQSASGSRGQVITAPTELQSANKSTSHTFDREDESVLQENSTPIAAEIATGTRPVMRQKSRSALAIALGIVSGLAIFAVIGSLYLHLNERPEENRVIVPVIPEQHAGIGDAGPLQPLPSAVKDTSLEERHEEEQIVKKPTSSHRSTKYKKSKKEQKERTSAKAKRTVQITETPQIVKITEKPPGQSESQPIQKKKKDVQLEDIPWDDIQQKNSKEAADPKDEQSGSDKVVKGRFGTRIISDYDED